MMEILAVALVTGGFTLAAALGSAWQAQRGEDRRAQAAADNARRAALHTPIVDFATASRAYLNNLEIVAMMMTKSKDPLHDWIEYTGTDSGKQLQLQRERLDRALAELRQLLRDQRGRVLLEGWDRFEREVGELQAAIQRRPRPAGFDEISALGKFLGITSMLRDVTRGLENHAAQTQAPRIDGQSSTTKGPKRRWRRQQETPPD